MPFGLLCPSIMVSVYYKKEASLMGGESHTYLWIETQAFRMQLEVILV